MLMVKPGLKSSGDFRFFRSGGTASFGFSLGLTCRFNVSVFLQKATEVDFPVPQKLNRKQLSE
jgi:hypothetical protein